MPYSIDDVVAALARIEAKVDALAKGAPAASTAAAVTAPIVPDDGKDEEVKYDPPSWGKDGKAPVAPCMLSKGPRDWQEAIAKYAEWKGKKMDKAGEVNDRGEPKSYFEWRRAARARGWMARKQAEPATSQADLLDEIPF